MLLLLLPPLLQTHRTAVLMSTTGYFAGQSTAVVEILQSSAPYFLIFVLVLCSPLLLLSGKTTGYLAGQSTAVVEILQSSATGLVMVMMMVGNNAAVAATATAANTQNSGAHEDDRLLCWPVYCCC